MHNLCHAHSPVREIQMRQDYVGISKQALNYVLIGWKYLYPVVHIHTCYFDLVRLMQQYPRFMSIFYQIPVNPVCHVFRATGVHWRVQMDAV
jgi:hypothetical protein